MSETKTAPNVLDVRSLAAFRILLGMFLLFDVYDRTSLGKYDLAWYTSIPEDQSYLDVNDTPHKAPLHKIWFYRGSYEFIVASFIASALFSIFFMLGLFCDAPLKIALWIVQVAQQSRCMNVSDGSDSFIRQLLLWAIFLPVSQIWSLDAILRQRSTSTPHCSSVSTSTAVKGLPCLAVTLQIALMYWGTVFSRTFDSLFNENRSGKPLSLNHFFTAALGRNKQWAAGMSAVHYALSGPFGSRDHVITRVICQTKWLSQTLTLSSMLIEFVTPLACLCMGSQRHWPAMILFLFHAGLLIMFDIPNWQLLGMLMQVLWIPTHVWNKWGWTIVDSAYTAYKKSDGDTDAVTKLDQKKIRANDTSQHLISTRWITSRIAKGLQLFFFVHMIYNWLIHRGWLPKLDNGDIGQGLRLSQHWGMFSEVAVKAYTMQLTGKLLRPTPNRGGSRMNVTRLDLFHYIKTGHDRIQDPTTFIPTDMTFRFPSQRWEKALHDVPQRSRMGAFAKHFCYVICRFVNDDRRRHGQQPIAQVEMRYQPVASSPPGSLARYKENNYAVDQVVEMNC